MGNNISLRYWLFAFVLCIVVVILSVRCVDRPVADFIDDKLPQTLLFTVLERAMGSLRIVVVLGMLFLLASACWVIAGKRLSAWNETLLLCSWSLAWALSATVTLKRIFGRAQPELWTGRGPSYTHHGAYGFYPLHRRAGYEAFPSGTMAVASAIISALWFLMPRFRPLWVLILIFVAVAPILTNAHFVADVIGGGFLGVSIGWMTVRLLRREVVAQR